MSDHISTQRLIIRSLTAADGDAVVEILNDLQVSRWLARIPHPFGHADIRLAKEDGSSLWPDLAAITMGGRLIGGIRMGDRLGYYLAPEHWGRGIVTEAAEAVVRFSIDTLQVPEIRSGYFEGNTASARILERLGFKEVERCLDHCAALDTKLPSVELLLQSSDFGMTP